MTKHCFSYLLIAGALILFAQGANADSLNNLPNNAIQEEVIPNADLNLDQGGVDDFLGLGFGLGFGWGWNYYCFYYPFLPQCTIGLGFVDGWWGGDGWWGDDDGWWGGGFGGFGGRGRHGRHHGGHRGGHHRGR